MLWLRHESEPELTPEKTATEREACECRYFGLGLVVGVGGTAVYIRGRQQGDIPHWSTFVATQVVL